MPGGLLENLKLAADETERLGRATSKVRDDLEAVSAIEPDAGGAPMGGALGPAFAAASIAPVGGATAPGLTVPRLSTGAGGGAGNSIAGSPGGGGTRISMGGGGASGGGIRANPDVNAFIRSQVLGGEDATRVLISVIADLPKRIAKELRGDGGSGFRIGGGL